MREKITKQNETNLVITAEGLSELLPGIFACPPASRVATPLYFKRFPESERPTFLPSKHIENESKEAKASLADHQLNKR